MAIPRPCLQSAIVSISSGFPGQVSISQALMNTQCCNAFLQQQNKTAVELYENKFPISSSLCHFEAGVQEVVTSRTLIDVPACRR